LGNNEGNFSVTQVPYKCKYRKKVLGSYFLTHTVGIGLPVKG